jgi:hypothetical protein
MEPNVAFAVSSIRGAYACGPFIGVHGFQKKLILIALCCEWCGYITNMKKNNKLAIHIEEDPTEHDFPQQHSRFDGGRAPTLPDEDDERNNHEIPHHPAKVIEF